MRQVLYRGQVYWVDDQNRVLGIASGGFGGAAPGLSDARQADILSRLPDADIVGMTGLGVVPGGEKSVGIQRAEAQGLPIPKKGGQVPTYRPLGEAADNNRGNSVIIKPSTTNPLICQTPPNPGQDAEDITIALGWQFANGNPNTDITGTALAIRALLTWGIGTAVFEAQCDWVRGAMITIPASFLRVGARFDSPGDPAGLDVKLDVGFAYGAFGKKAAQFTFFHGPLGGIPDGPGFVGGVVAAGATVGPFRIPLFAQSFNVLSIGALGLGAGPVVPLTITQSGFTGGAGFPGSAAYTYQDGTNLGNQGLDVPVVNGAHYFFITNNSLNDAIVNVIFKLAF